MIAPAAGTKVQAATSSTRIPSKGFVIGFSLFQYLIRNAEETSSDFESNRPPPDGLQKRLKTSYHLTVYKDV